MSSILEELGPDGPTATHVLRPPGPVLIGRGRGCGVRLNDTRISRHHCVLTYQKDRWHVEDLGSTNGTLVNGQKITRAELLDGDTLTVGRVRLCYRADVTLSGEKPAIAPVTAPAAEEQPAQVEGKRTKEIATLAATTPSEGSGARLIGGRYELG